MSQIVTRSKSKALNEEARVKKEWRSVRDSDPEKVESDVDQKDLHKEEFVECPDESSGSSGSDSDASSGSGDSVTSEKRSKKRDDYVSSDILKLVLSLIPTYEGSTEVVKLYEFIDIIENIQTEWLVNDKILLPIIKSRLTGNAGVWLRSFKQKYPKGHKKDLKSWRRLKRALRKDFIPTESLNEIKDKLFNLKLTTSMRDYVTLFRTYTQQIPEENEDTLIHLFLKGVPQQIRMLVKSYPKNLASLERVMQAALNLEIQEIKTPIVINKVSNTKCTKCGRDNHLVDKCWDIYGKPKDYRRANIQQPQSSSRSQPVAKAVLTEYVEIVDPIIDEIKNLSVSKMVLGSSKDKKFSEYFTVCLDSACTDHMVNTQEVLSNLVPCNILFRF